QDGNARWPPLRYRSTTKCSGPPCRRSPSWAGRPRSARSPRRWSGARATPTPAGGAAQRRPGDRDWVPARLGSDVPEGHGLADQQRTRRVVADRRRRLAHRPVGHQRNTARVRELWSAHLAELRKARRAKVTPGSPEPDAAEPAGERGWKEQLLDELMGM